MSYETITYAVEAGVARVTLNDPASLNAFTAQMGADLAHVFARMEVDSAVRAAILTGAGRGFCSGANLAQRGAALEAGTADTGAVLERYVNPLVAATKDRRVPLVTAVNGPVSTGTNVGTRSLTTECKTYRRGLRRGHHERNNDHEYHSRGSTEPLSGSRSTFSAGRPRVG